MLCPFRMCSDPVQLHPLYSLEWSHPIAGTLLVRGIAKGTRGTVLQSSSEEQSSVSNAINKSCVRNPNPPLALVDSWLEGKLWDAADCSKSQNRRKKAPSEGGTAARRTVIFQSSLCGDLYNLVKMATLSRVKDVQHLMDIKVFYNLVWRRVSREFGTEEPLDANCVCRALGLDIVERDDTALLGRGLLLLK